MDFTVISRFGAEHHEMLCREVNDYWRRLDESDRFDVEGIEAPLGAIPLIAYDCQRRCPVLVKRYASAGLHRYNMLEGTNFKLGAVTKYNKLQNFVSPYYITLLAQDSVSGSHQTFQVLVDEQRVGRLDIIVEIARPRGMTTKEPHIPSFSVADELPQWPDSFSDTNRFYLMKQSEFLNNDWIYLYLELVLCKIERVGISDSDLSKLKIVKAVIETKEDMLPPDEILNAKTAVVYITFKGMAKAQVAGEHDERKAIVRRILNEDTGRLSLMGHLIGENPYIDIDPVTFFNSPAHTDAVRRAPELLLPPYMLPAAAVYGSRICCRRICVNFQIWVKLSSYILCVFWIFQICVSHET
ncbi:PREDICTED: UPF0725 protein At1g02770-like [Camelina sativa]|uniref:UPF0725 protein At1g02770-like n=1 Tax=Camelina sativa TaxID=90675 RepID=A0ABM0XI15_CAMSA|nr:PREDICTED: UPF0725 protein At1g02770-like [Camelina sativa]